MTLDFKNAINGHKDLNTGNMIYIYNKDCKFVFVNYSAAEVLGLLPSDMHGKHWRELGLLSEIMLPFEKNLRQVFKMGNSIVATSKSNFKSYKSYEYRLDPIWGEDNKVDYVVCSARDTTRERIRDNESPYKKIFDKSLIGEVIIDMEGRIIDCNSFLANMLGYDKNELKNILLADIIHPEDLEEELIVFQEMFAGIRGYYQIEKRYITKKGEVVWGNLTATTIRDEMGNPQILFGIVEDITERKKVENALRESEEKFRSAFEYASIGMAILSTNGQWLRVNNSLCQIVGFSEEELLQKNFQQITHPNDLDVSIKYLNQLLAGETSSYQFEKRYINKSGKIVWAEVSGSLVRDTDGQPIYFITQIQNITRRKLAEQELHQSKQRFEKAFKVSPGLIFISRLADGKCLEVNDSMIKVSGYSREEIIGNTAVNLNVWVNKAEREKFLELLKIQCSVTNYEMHFRIKSGEIRTGLLSAELIQFNDRQCIIGVVNDITERKKFETEMARMDRLNMVGQLAAGLGHEVRNPLTTVRGFLQFLGGKQENNPYKKYYDLMIKELDRANSIITEFLSMARTKPINLKVVNLNRILESLYPLLESNAILADKQIDLQLGTIPDTLLDEEGIRQMVLNFAQNGLEAMLPKGKLTIKTYLEEEAVVLAIQDEGLGIPPEVLEKIGTPFFTTKEKGTGLGLVTCFSIAERHNATIKVDTNSSGTTFYIKFKPGI